MEITEKKDQTVNPVTILRCSIGIIYFWFGILKLFYGLSPAEQIASQTIHQLTFSLLPDHTAIELLAVWECALGLLLLLCKWMKPALIFLFVHMAFTFSPFLLFPQAIFLHFPYGFTLLGQYIMKNLIIIGGACVLWQQYARRVSPV